MNDYVPDFHMDEDYSIPTSAAATPTPIKKSSMPDDDIVELLWHNGQVVMQPQNQRCFKKSPPPPRFQDFPKHNHNQNQNDHLFMQEEEMVSWLQYDPPFEHDFCADLLCGPHSSSSVTATPPLTTSAVASASRPPVPPIRRETSRIQNFPHFGRHNPMLHQSNSKSLVRESTVVDSSETPTGQPESRVSQAKPSCSSGWDHQSACETMTATPSQSHNSWMYT